jgi:predicted PilT family ATPase
MLIEPIITEWVSDPRMIDRLIAHRAEGVVVRGAPGARATVVDAAAIVGRRRDGDTYYSFLLFALYP